MVRPLRAGVPDERTEPARGDSLGAIAERVNKLVDIFDEVDQELRAERAQNLLVRYSGVIVGVALAIVGAAGAWQGWRWYEARQDLAAATSFVSAITAADTSQRLDPAARASLAGAFEALAASAPEGYRTLARLRAAALKAEAGDLHGASALWDQVAGDASVDPLLRDFAVLVEAQHQIDRGDPARLEGRLRPLMEPGNAWRALAQEQLALLDLRQGRTAAAKTALRKLSEDVTTTAGVRSRATALLSRLDE